MNALNGQAANSFREVLAARGLDPEAATQLEAALAAELSEGHGDVSETLAEEVA